MKIKILTLSFFALTAVFALSVEAESRENHSFSSVSISYPSDGRYFKTYPVDFCDEKHIKFIKDAIKNRKSDYNGHYIVIYIPEREIYYQRSLVAIDADTRIVYPVPIDFYSGNMKNKKAATSFGELKYDLKDSKLCIDGSIFVFRAEEDGNFCFTFDGEKFVGHKTAYMSND